MNKLDFIGVLYFLITLIMSFSGCDPMYIVLSSATGVLFFALGIFLDELKEILK